MPISDESSIHAPRSCPALPKSERGFSPGSQESRGSRSVAGISRGPAPKGGSSPFKVLGNEPLLELATKKPLRLEELETEKVLSRKQIDRYGTNLLQEIHRAMALPDGNLPVYSPEARPELPWPVRRRVKALKAWRDMRAKTLGMEPGILLNNALINDLALQNPRSMEEMESIPGLKKWRQNHFGREILTVQKTPTARAVAQKPNSKISERVSFDE